MRAVGRWGTIAAVIGVIGVMRAVSKQLRFGLGWDNDAALRWFRNMSDLLGYWAIPAYIGVHTLTLALCLPYAVFFEAGASLLFGFFPAVFCVFSAKILGASLSFGIGRSSSSAVDWVHRNKYFNLLSRGVERDGWRFVLLARFSPIPSYIINYALAATEVGFVVDFLLPTVIGCLPMILQNTSIGSLASAAVASGSASKKSQAWSYVFPLIGILSGILISLRIKKYSADILVPETGCNLDVHDSNKTAKSTQQRSSRKRSKGLKRN